MDIHFLSSFFHYYTLLLHNSTKKCRNFWVCLMSMQRISDNPLEPNIIIQSQSNHRPIISRSLDSPLRSHFWSRTPSWQLPAAWLRVPGAPWSELESSSYSGIGRAFWAAAMKDWPWFSSMGFLIRGSVARPSSLCLLVLAASHKDTCLVKKLLIGKAGTQIFAWKTRSQASRWMWRFSATWKGV